MRLVLVQYKDAIGQIPDRRRIGITGIQSLTMQDSIDLVNGSCFSKRIGRIAPDPTLPEIVGDVPPVPPSPRSKVHSNVSLSFLYTSVQ